MKPKPSDVLLIYLFAGLSSSTVMAQAQDVVRAHEAINHVGKLAMVCGLVASADYRRDTRGDQTYLNFDKLYPDQDFTAIIYGTDRRSFDIAPETLRGYKVCVYGKVGAFRGQAQIVLKRQEQLNYKPPVETESE